MSSVEQNAKRESTEANLFPQSANLEPDARTTSAAVQREQSGHTAKAKVPKPEKNASRSESPEKRNGRALLLRSFRALGTVLGLSMISGTFQSKSNMRSEQNARPVDAQIGGDSSEWADIVDHTIESDNERESVDSYVEFMRHRDVRRHEKRIHGGMLIWFNKTKLGETEEEDDADDTEPEDDSSCDNPSDCGPSIPWFESNP